MTDQHTESLIVFVVLVVFPIALIGVYDFVRWCHYGPEGTITFALYRLYQAHWWIRPLYWLLMLGLTWAGDRHFFQE